MFPIESLFMHESASRYCTGHQILEPSLVKQPSSFLLAHTQKPMDMDGGALLQWQAPRCRWRFLSIMRGGYRYLYFDVEASKVVPLALQHTYLR